MECNNIDCENVGSDFELLATIGGGRKGLYYKVKCNVCGTIFNTNNIDSLII